MFAMARRHAAIRGGFGVSLTMLWAISMQASQM
jgi:hypothetical protein